MEAGSVEGLIAGVGAMRVDEFVKTFSEIKPDVKYRIKKHDNTYMDIGQIVKKSESFTNREGLPVAVYENTSNHVEYIMNQNYPDGYKVNAERAARVYVNDRATGEYIGRLTISTSGGRRKSRHRRSKKNRRTKRRKA